MGVSPVVRTKSEIKQSVNHMPIHQNPNATKPVILLGAGGHARVLISLLHLIDRPIAAVLDDDPAKHGERIDGVAITGGFDQLNQHRPDAVQLVNALGSAHRPTARQAVYEQHTELGYTFATLIHPAASIAPETTIEQGVQIMAGAIIQPGATLKANGLINTAASIDHDTTVGEHCHIAPGAAVCGNVTIGQACHIGAGAAIIQGRTIGEGAVVGAGATVLSNIPADQVVVGTPARPFSG